VGCRAHDNDDDDGGGGLNTYPTSLSSRLSSPYGSTAQFGPWPPPLGCRNNNLFTDLDC
jgi:hypothetical protein